MFGSLDLRVERGGALHLVGPNGIGKSSLIRMLAGLLRPSPTGLQSPPMGSRGVIDWEGEVALMDEKPALDEQKPLGEALAFWSAVDGLPACDLARVGLDRLADVPVRYLSTGQRKRAAFARLLGQGSPNWLLDEPLNGLDDDGVRMVERLVSEHRANGGLVVVASHQPILLDDRQTIDLRDHPA